jgi:hypothetical protein
MIKKLAVWLAVFFVPLFLERISEVPMFSMKGWRSLPHQGDVPAQRGAGFGEISVRVLSGGCDG